MNYYERHLGDYAKDTAHLSMMEHGAYTLLLDRYYATELPIPADQAHRIARARTRDERAAVDVVLAEFFTLTDGQWVSSRCVEEIAKAHHRIESARENGKRGGRPRKPNENPLGSEEKPNGFSVGSEMETGSKAHHVPDTTSVSEIPQRVVASKPRPTKKAPPGFVLTDAMRDWASSACPGIDVEAETAKFRDHTFGTARVDWLGTWRNWMRRAAENVAGRRPVQRAANDHPAWEGVE